MMASKSFVIDQTKKETVKSILVDLAHDLKKHYHVEKAELTYQKLETQMLINLIGRYHKYDKAPTITNVNSQKEIDLKKLEMENDMYSHVINIRRSNKKVSDSLDFLQPISDQLKSLAEQIRMHDENHENHKCHDQDAKSLSNYVDIMFDIKRNFRKRIIDRHVMQDMLNIQYEVTIEVYQELLLQHDENNDVHAKIMFFSDLMET